MGRHVPRMSAAIAVIAALVLVPSGSSTAAFTGPPSGVTSVPSGTGPLRAGVSPGPPVRPSRTLAAPTGPQDLRCYPIGHLVPATPPAIRLPEIAPQVPGPIALPQVAVTCAGDVVPGLPNLMGAPLDTRRGPALGR